MITGINEPKTLTKHIFYECNCKFDGRKCNSNQNWSNDKGRGECKNLKEHLVCKTDYTWNPVTCSCKNGKYLASIIDNSVLTCDKIIKTTKTVPTKTVPTKSTSTNFYNLLAFLLATIALLIAVSIYCYRIKYKAK